MLAKGGEQMNDFELRRELSRLTLDIKMLEATTSGRIKKIKKRIERIEQHIINQQKQQL